MLRLFYILVQIQKFLQQTCQAGFWANVHKTTQVGVFVVFIIIIIIIFNKILHSKETM